MSLKLSVAAWVEGCPRKITYDEDGNGPVQARPWLLWRGFGFQGVGYSSLFGVRGSKDNYSSTCYTKARTHKLLGGSGLWLEGTGGSHSEVWDCRVSANGGSSVWGLRLRTSVNNRGVVFFFPAFRGT